jgi:hypothetical protein
LTIKRNRNGSQKKWTRNKNAFFKVDEPLAGNSIVSPAEASGEGFAVQTDKLYTAPGDISPSSSHEKTRSKAAGHGSTYFVQRVESWLKVSIADAEYLGVSISTERLRQMLENVGIEIDGFPEGGAVPLFHDTFCHERRPVIYC